MVRARGERGSYRGAGRGGGTRGAQGLSTHLLAMAPGGTMPPQGHDIIGWDATKVPSIPPAPSSPPFELRDMRTVPYSAGCIPMLAPCGAGGGKGARVPFEQQPASAGAPRTPREISGGAPRSNWKMCR